MAEVKKKRVPVIFTAIAVILILGLSGCASVRGQWQQAKRKDTIQAYRAFIHKYPNSPFTEKAREKLESISWSQARSANTRQGYHRFLKEFPNGGHHRDARLAIETIDLAIASKKNTKKAYLDFLKNHPRGALSQKARHLLEELDWKWAKRERTFHAYQRFLKKYPHGKFYQEARKKVAEGTWIEIQSRGNSADYEQFLKNFPESRFAKNARARLQELKKKDARALRYYDKIRGSKSYKSFSGFIWRYPTSHQVPAAVESIYRLLRQKYPAGKYTMSLSLEKLKQRLPEAIRNRRPLLVAFAPVVVYSSRKHWQWTTYFRELAGASVFFNQMSPRINTREGKHYTFAGGGDGMLGTCQIRPFGSCRHTWKCWGDFEGAKVILNYGKGLAISRTTLAIKK
jgi:outer membrane protein assembly factor BamD (BamD/ComL family)